MLSVSRQSGDHDRITEFIKKRKVVIAEHEQIGNKIEADIERLKTSVMLANIYGELPQRGFSAADEERVLAELISWFRHEVPKARLDKVRGSLKENQGVQEIQWRAKQPSRDLKEIAGMDEVLDQLNMELITAIEHGASSGQPLPGFDDEYSNPLNFLFLGPPGVGKTHVAEGVAFELYKAGYPVNFIPVLGGDIKTSEYGGSEQRIRSLLEWANDLPGMSIVFIDEFQELATRNEHEATAAIVNTLLAKTSGANAVNNVIIIGASNRPEDIDPAIYSRFEAVWFPLPGKDIRIKILEHCFDGYNGLVAFKTLKDCEDLTESMSGRDLKKAVKYASTLAKRESMNNGGKIVIKPYHVRIGLTKVKKEIEKYDS